jgi:hypothetical protein
MAIFWYQAGCNILSVAPACMMISAAVLWLRSLTVKGQPKCAVLIFDLVTFMAEYRYLR